MLSYRFKMIGVGVLTAAAAITFFATFSRAYLFPKMEPEAVVPLMIEEEARQKVASPERAARLRIPKVSVDAEITPVGIAASGNMAVPRSYADVGWYKYGTVPGEIGSAVIDGHFDNGFGMDAVFKHLGELEPGDDIYVRTAEGAELRFVVREVGSYDNAAVPLARVFERTDGAYLNLITCDGEWSPEKETYTKRLIVFAELL